MGRYKFVFKQKIVKISETQQNMLDEIMQSGKFPTEAEAFRQGLVMIHNKLFPPYLRPSVNQEIKREKHEKEKAFNSVPDEEFAKTLKGTEIYTDEDGQKFLLFRAIGNYIGAVPLSIVKEWASKDNQEYNYHKQIIEKQEFEPYEKEIAASNSIKRDLANRWGVVISYDPNIA
jgi:hypothetical protein